MSKSYKKIFLNNKNVNNIYNQIVESDLIMLNI